MFGLNRLRQKGFGHKGGGLGLMAVGNQTVDQIDQAIDW